MSYGSTAGAAGVVEPEQSSSPAPLVLGTPRKKRSLSRLGVVALALLVCGTGVYHAATCRKLCSPDTARVNQTVAWRRQCSYCSGLWLATLPAAHKADDVQQVAQHVPAGHILTKEGSFSVLRSSPRWDQKAIACAPSGCLYEEGRGCNRTFAPAKLAGPDAGAGAGYQCMWGTVNISKAACAAWDECEAFWCDDAGCYARGVIEPVVSWAKSTALYVYEGFCNDEYNSEKCFLWAHAGECATNRDWMENNCCGSCDFADGKCVDDPAFYKSCGFWALKGECANDPVWMREHCCRSCCVDDEEYHHKCVGWQAEGKCTTKEHKLWMADHCCGSCFTDIFEEEAEPIVA